MKKLEEFKELLLGTRLKRLGDRLQGDLDSLFRDRGLELSVSHCSPLVLLRANGPMAITELAEALGQTHSAVSQLSKKMMDAGIIESLPDPGDDRRRLLQVTGHGESMAGTLRTIWADIEQVLAAAIAETGFEFLSALHALEERLQQKSLRQRLEDRENTRNRTAVEIVSYRPAYRDDFRRLNVEWLEKFFYVEEIDDRVLSDPETHILKSGGFIYFACIGSDVVGTAALIRAENDRYELSKMSVTEGYKGLGIGRKLAVAAIRQFEETGARELYLESNSRLTPAISLYESLGFVHQPAREDSEYKRADVYMLYCPNEP